MSASDLQEEEKEVLLSIYDGDPRFKVVSSTAYQYKYGEDNEPKSFLLEIAWTSGYPLERPSINMDTFYNKHLTDEVKANIVKAIEKECDPLIGEAMTYTLFEWAKENEADLTELQPDLPIAVSEVAESLNEINLDQDSAKKEKKIQLTKAQKRRQWDKSDCKGEKPRGWDWVDIVKHLSQTGSKQDQDSASA